MTQHAFYHARRTAQDFAAGQFRRRTDAGPTEAGKMLVRRSERVRLLHDLQTKRAAEQLGRLPERGETWHVLTQSNFYSWTLVPCFLSLASPAVITSLSLSTLSWAAPFMRQLLELHDDGKIGPVDLLYSVFFASHNQEHVDRLTAEFAARPGLRLAADLNHAKVIAAAFSDGRRITVEGSGNMRACASREQITITADADVYDFHRTWIAAAITAALEKERT